MNIEINLTGTAIVAWWGAIVATFVLLWDIYKWRTSGARLRLLVRSGMGVLGDPDRENLDLVSVRVTNIGDRATTITTVGLVHYENWWRWKRRRPGQTFVIPRPYLNRNTPNLPYVLEVGQEWMGLIEQTEDVTAMAKSGILIAEVYDSVHPRAIEGRVIVDGELTR